MRSTNSNLNKGNRTMDYLEALDTIKDAQLHASADFYRMQFSDTVALGLQDQPMAILTDVVSHGSTEAKALLAEAVKCGYVVEVPQAGYIYYDVVDVEKCGTSFHFRSHVAMQIAYPAIYRDYFGGDYVWVFSDPRMHELCVLCISCLTNKNHPSDYFGEHEIPDPKAKAVKVPKVKPEPDKAFAAWVAACQEYNTQLSEAWEEGKDAVTERKAAVEVLRVERDIELDRLRAAMSGVAADFKTECAQLEELSKAVQQRHADLKIQGKPQRVDFKQ